MKQNILITGASKGIGRELAEIHASKGDNLVLVARSSDKLKELAQELETKYGITATTIAKDLSKTDAAKQVFDEVKDCNIDIDCLINNAGFGDYAPFADVQWQRYRDMIDLNVTTLTEFCHLYIRDWMGRKKGRILNVASTAAFQPGPKMAVYFATKAYVLSFSQAIGYEARPHGITVTALCPGPTETYFMEDSQMRRTRMVKSRRLPKAHDVAMCGYRAMMSGRAVAIHGRTNRTVAFIARLAPRRLAVSITDRLL